MRPGGPAQAKNNSKLPEIPLFKGPKRGGGHPVGRGGLGIGRGGLGAGRGGLGGGLGGGMRLPGIGGHKPAGPIGGAQ